MGQRIDAHFAVAMAKLRAACGSETIERASREDPDALQKVLCVLDGMLDGDKERAFALKVATACAKADEDAARIAEGSTDWDFPQALNDSPAELSSLKWVADVLKKTTLPGYEEVIWNFWDALEPFGHTPIATTRPEDSLFQNTAAAEVRLGKQAHAFLVKLEKREGHRDLKNALFGLLAEVAARRGEDLLKAGVPKENLEEYYKEFAALRYQNDFRENGPMLFRPGYVDSVAFSPYHLIDALADAAKAVEGDDDEITMLVEFLNLEQSMFSEELDFFKAPGFEEPERGNCRVVAAILETYAETQADKFSDYKIAFQENCLTLAAIIRQALGEVLDRPRWVRQRMEALEQPKPVLHLHSQMVEEALRNRTLWQDDLKTLLQDGTTPSALARNRAALNRIAKVAGLDVALLGKLPSFEVEHLRPMLEPLIEKDLSVAHEIPSPVVLDLEGSQQMAPVRAAIKDREISDLAKSLGFEIHVRARADPDWDFPDRPDNPNRLHFYLKKPDGKFYQLMDPMFRHGEQWEIDSDKIIEKVCAVLLDMKRVERVKGASYSFGDPKPIRFGERTLI